MNKILLIEWGEITSNDSSVYSYILNNKLEVDLFGNMLGEWKDEAIQSKFEDRVNNAIDIMSSVGIETQDDIDLYPNPYEYSRGCISHMLRFIFNCKNSTPNLDRPTYKESVEKYKEAYEKDTDLFESLYYEYISYFESNHKFIIDEHVQLLIDKKPKDWQLGIFSTSKGRHELDYLLSLKDSSDISLSSTFSLNFGLNYGGFEEIFDEIDNFFGKKVQVFIFSRVPLIARKRCISKYGNIKVIGYHLGKYYDDYDGDYHKDSEAFRNRIFDLFDYNNPDNGVISCVSLKTGIDKESWSIGELDNYSLGNSWNYDVVSRNDVVFKEESYKNIGLIQNLAFLAILALVISLPIFLVLYFHSVYELQSGHWSIVILTSVFGAILCGGIPLVLISSGIKKAEIFLLRDMGLIGGFSIPIISDYDKSMGFLLSALFLYVVLTSHDELMMYIHKAKEKKL